MAQLRVMRNSLKVATPGNVRGRVVAHPSSNVPYIAVPVSPPSEGLNPSHKWMAGPPSHRASSSSQFELTGKVRWKENSFPLDKACTITWFTSRAVSYPCGIKLVYVCIAIHRAD